MASLYRVSIVLKLEKCAKINMDSFPHQLCRLHVMKNIHSQSNATVQVMEAGYFRTSGSSRKHRRPHYINTTRESAFLWQMPTPNSIIVTALSSPPLLPPLYIATIEILLDCTFFKLSSCGMFIEKIYIEYKKLILLWVTEYNIQYFRLWFDQRISRCT